MPDTGIKRFIIDSATRAKLAALSQEYAIPMQVIAGCVLTDFVERHAMNSVRECALMRTWRISYLKQLSARMSQVRRAKSERRNGD